MVGWKCWEVQLLCDVVAGAASAAAAAAAAATGAAIPGLQVSGVLQPETAFAGLLDMTRCVWSAYAAAWCQHLAVGAGM